MYEAQSARADVARLAASVDDLLRFASFPREDEAVAEAVEAVSTEMSRLEAVRALLVAQLEAAGWAGQQGATSTRVWLHQRLHITVGAAHRSVVLGKHLTARPVLCGAVADGAVTADQALVIGDVLGDLPREGGPELVDQVEASLIEVAPTLTPTEVGKVGERILELVAPELAEQAEAARLARRDEEARSRRVFHISSDPHSGGCRLSGRLDAEATAVLRLAIEALARPLPAADGTKDPRSADQRNADALAELCRLSLDESRLPEHGGTRPQLLITTGYDMLIRELSAGTLESGIRLSAQAVRRLACDAQIIPAVLGSKGELLDLGRSQRLVGGALRIALIARDGGCTFPTCDRPARWCQAHHVIPWAQGGPTSLGNSTLLCGAHHRLIHAGDWQVTKSDDGRVAYVPPPYVDPLQRPRFNQLRMRR